MSNFLTGKLRLLYLMRFFTENTDEEHTTNAKELIEYLKTLGIVAERKAIYSDIEALRAAGMDIISKGKRGGCYLASGDFQLAELKLLVDAVQVSKFITPKKSQELIKKLSVQTSKYNADAFRRDVVITNRTKTPNEHIYYNIDHIHAAIAQRREITFKYMEWSLDKKLVEKPKDYRVSPWLLVWDDENYYLVGYDDAAGERRHYRVDKMKDVVITESECRNEQAYRVLDKAAYGKATFNMFGGQRARLKIRFANSLMGAVLDRFGTDISTMPCGTDSFYVYLDIDVSERFFGWLAGFGDKAKIVEPIDTLRAFREFIRNIMRVYE